MTNADRNTRVGFLSTFFFIITVALSAQELPIAFPTGAHLGEVESLYEQHPESLIESCAFNLDSAGRYWIAFLGDIEVRANELGVDLNGVRLVLTVFFEADGRIRHLGFSRQVSSRNIREEVLTAFFRQFARGYRMPLEAGNRFFHEGPAAFPLKPIRAGD